MIMRCQKTGARAVCQWVGYDAADRPVFQSVVGWEPVSQYAVNEYGNWVDVGDASAKRMISLRLDQQLLNKTDQVAETLRRSRTSLIEEAVVSLLAKYTSPK